MPATTRDKSSYKLFKVAAELNIGKETIAEFLKAKGFDIPVKPTTGLTQEMYDLVMGKFEKEHRQIEKQRKKVDAYHERRSKTTKEDGEVPAEAKAEAPKKASKKAAEEEVVVEPAEQPVAADAVLETVTAEAEPVSPESMEPSIERPPVKVPEDELPVVKPEESTPTAELADRQEAEIAAREAAAAEYVERSEPITSEAPVAEPPVAEPPKPSRSKKSDKTAAEKTPVAEVTDRKPEPVAETVPQPEPVQAVEPAAPVETAVVEPTPEPEAARAEPVAEAAAEAAPAQPVVTAAAEESAAAAPVSEAPTAEVSDGGEVEAEADSDEDGPKEFRGVTPKLQGLTVVGKIDLGTKPADKDKKDRRPRKRIRESAKSVDINREQGTARTAATPSPTAGPGAPARPTAAPLGTAGADKRKKRGAKGTFVPVDQQQVSRAIRQTFSTMGDSSKSNRQHRSRDRRMMREEREMRRAEEAEMRASVLQVTEFVTVAELAGLMNVDVGQVIGKCIGLGLMVSINQRLDKDTIQLVADEFGFSVEFQQDYAEDVLADQEDAPEALIPRAPIVTIMGHVDHGKTSLLDYIRNSNVVAGESGGITQHIGAYSVQLPDGRKITFLDTPGHEAFTAMRARGAQVTDIVILVVAADDAVMPQTVEAISHAQSAGVPMVVAINKIDKPESNIEKIKQQLSDRGVLVEEWGGRYQAVEVSAKKGINVDKLLETVLLEAEILDLKANPKREARGVVIEAEIDRGKGIVATVLVQKGTLKVGDDFVAGIYSGRVRALMDERGRRIEEAGPSEPAQVLGFSGVPTAGDTLVVLENEQDAREIATRRQQLHREQAFKQQRHLTLDEISSQIARGGVQHLPLIIKGDVDGSVEALADSLLRLSTPEVQVSVVLKSVGEISESDVLLAAASQAIIIGFHVRPNLKARKLAEREGVEIRTYQIIYDTVNEIRAALEGMLRPEQKEEITGTVEIRDIFKISRIGVVAGCYVADGKITRNDRVRLLRDGLEVWNGSVGTLRRLKDDVREVEQGFECGLTLDGMSDIKVGDVIESYRTVEIKRKLENAASY